MLTIDKFAGRLESYLNTEQIDLVRSAYYFAEKAHAGQVRRSGEPYITHPLEVASLLADMHMDHLSLMAAMLHDVIEDTGIEKQVIQREFGDVVADLVDGVSKLTCTQFKNKTLAQAENFQKMALAMAKDIRVILVKLADRLHNMRTLGVLMQEKRSRIAKETLDIYVPIASRLGMYALRRELEDLCFSAMYPMRSRLIRRAAQDAKRKRQDLLRSVQKTVTDRLRKEGLNGAVTIREKHLYSVYQKMRNQEKIFSEIMEMFSFRIIVDNIDSCYRALGVAHNLYKPIPGRFRDYIAIPKVNGYQSLHTTLFGLQGAPVDIQIRTQEMENIANSGIAAHWLYSDDKKALSDSRARTHQWLKGLLELQRNARDPLEFIENVKIDLFPDEIYVFTPKGDIFDLPKGATPIDFAYAIDVNIGSACVACRIDKRMATLNQPLQSGQTIEIITGPNVTSDAAWLNFVMTGKARSNIHRLLKSQRRNESIIMGRQLLSRALIGFDTSLDLIGNDIVLQQTQLECGSLDDLLEDIGLGNKVAYAVARMLAGSVDNVEIKNRLENAEPEAPLSIRGTDGMVISFDRCCYPIPGEAVVGYIDSDRGGIVVHADNCRNLSKVCHNTDRILDIMWDKSVTGEFSIALQIKLNYQKGVIAAIATSVTAAEGNIGEISMDEKASDYCQIHLLINVRDRLNLARVLRRLRMIKGVNAITRLREACTTTIIGDAGKS
ncbi:MAG: bifunctional (p)ppGpp synthetase/guanosine-3',5'-bis(diphosphate) 3'-pyrophosphohydrolase [Candidatus Endonucleobacter sp. (ex Gigantidas childressi)]|nr:bifunctional (p)ppGpp synthetase/guanosine-3',5'-bis(diphosphate) 3'-pyrophosphohydrolase [Candidatus Endonucleobacter sp. (ex Gigantidas childressi)]